MTAVTEDIDARVREQIAAWQREKAAEQRDIAARIERPIAELDLQIAEKRAELANLEDERRDKDWERECRLATADECDHLAEWFAAGKPVPAAQAVADALPAPQHTGGNAEDCPVCRPQIDQPGGVLYPWICRGADGPYVDPRTPETAARIGPQAVVPDVPYVALVGQDVTVHQADGESVWGRLTKPTPESIHVGAVEIPVSTIKRVVPDEPMPQPPPPPPSLAALESAKPIVTHHDPIVLPGDLADGPRREAEDTSASTRSGPVRALLERGAEALGLARRDDQRDGQDGDGDG